MTTDEMIYLSSRSNNSGQNLSVDNAMSTKTQKAFQKYG